VASRTEHRPWPLPSRPWTMAMHWHDLLFIHWPVSVGLLRPLVPASLQIDAYDGQAWIGVVPFCMTGVRPRFVPSLPWLSAFAEINVRTYVTADDKPGVWFFSLDAANRLAVLGARLTYHLPYYFARISIQESNNRIAYESRRARAGAHFAATYGPAGEPYQAVPGSLDYWLTERYCLYAANSKGRLFRGDIHHAPWPLQPAFAAVQANTMTAPLGLTLPQTTPLLHFARHLEVIAWGLEPV
jgi:uncharacterized protein YqjF (DUF2071 family)